MSININLNGNCVKIKHGKLVGIDPQASKEEFKRRRLLRLQQVRKQSKHLAEEVRNRVRKAEAKRLSQTHKKAAEAQDKRLQSEIKDLEAEYRNCLKEIGVGHWQGIQEEEAELVLAGQKEKANQIAQERGLIATEELKERQRKIREENEAVSRRKELNRVVEDTRAGLAVDLQRRREKVAQESSGSESEDADVEEVHVWLPEGGQTETNNMSSNLVTSRRNIQVEVEEKNKHSKKVGHLKQTQVKPKPTIRTVVEIHPEPKSTKNQFCETSNLRVLRADKENRPEVKDTCIQTEQDLSNPSRSVSPTRQKVGSGCFKKVQCSKEAAQRIEQEQHYEKGQRNEQQHRKGPRETRKGSSGRQGGNFASSSGKSFALSEVQVYDHPNRYKTKTLIPTSTLVERSTGQEPEALLDISKTSSELNMIDESFRRDQQAFLRGKAALEREKVHEDYREMMRKLPRFERIEAQVRKDRDREVDHMGKERLKQHERRRQNRIEGRYEVLFPTRKVVTLPEAEHVVEQDPTVLPFETIEIDSTDPSLNVGKWDHAPRYSHSHKTNASNGKSDIANAEERRKSLQKMIRLLCFHRDKLAREIEEGQPGEQDTLKRLIGDYDHVDELLKSAKGLEEGWSRLSSKSVGGSERGRLNQRQVEKSGRSRESSEDGKEAGPRKMESGRNREDRSKTEKEKEDVCCRSKPKCVHGRESSESTNWDKTKMAAAQTRKVERSDTETCVCGLDRKLCKKCAKKTTSPPSAQSTPKSPERVRKSPDRAHGSPGGIPKSPERTKSTETVPKVSPKKQKHHVCCHDVVKKVDEKRCDCKVVQCKAMDNLCEIIIKVGDDGEPKQLSKGGGKDVVIKAAIEQKVEDIPKQQPKVTKKSKSTKTPLWREQFTQNSTSSTSYYSPPDLQTVGCAVLGKKPQQGNICNDPTSSQLEENRNLMNYVRKLLQMSRGNIDNLDISTISEVSTPNASVIEAQANKPILQLQNIMNYFNLNKADIESMLAHSPDGSIPYTSNTTPSSSNRTTESSRQPERSNCSILQPDLYKLARNSCKKIDDLTAKIDKVRKEKQSILESTAASNNRDESTAYMELPSRFAGETSRESSPLSNGSIEEQLGKLLEIDRGFAEKLRTISKESTKDLCKSKGIRSGSESSPDPEDSLNSSERELLERYRNLRKVSALPQPLEQPEPTFVPILGNLKPKPVGTKPPPSKGLNTAHRFDRCRDAIPHELSTITEVDSQLFSRTQQSEQSLNLKDDLPRVVAYPTVPVCTPKLPTSTVPLRDSSGSSDSASSVERLLMSMGGMGWAISARQKTKEALALSSSSSSSLDISIRRRKVKLHDSSTTTTSEMIDLEYKESSSVTTKESPRLEGFNDLSSIPGSRTEIEDIDNHGTSTPIRKPDRSGNTFYDLSSANLEDDNKQVI